MTSKRGPQKRCENCTHFSGVVPGEKLNAEPAGFCNHPEKAHKVRSSLKVRKGGLCHLHVFRP